MFCGTPLKVLDRIVWGALYEWFSTMENIVHSFDSIHESHLYKNPAQMPQKHIFLFRLKHFLFLFGLDKCMYRYFISVKDLKLLLIMRW